MSEDTDKEEVKLLIEHIRKLSDLLDLTITRLSTNSDDSLLSLGKKPGRTIELYDGTPWTRNYVQRLGDQCNNPGSMNVAYSVENKLGAIGEYEGTKGNPTAIFPDYITGLAALLWRIGIEAGNTMEVYLYSYQGTDESSSYRECMMQHSGMSKDDIVSLDPENALKLCIAHSICEGNIRRPTQEEVNKALFKLNSITAHQ